MSAKIKDPIDPILMRLRTLAQESPSLAGVVQQYGSLLPILRDVDLQGEAVSLSGNEAREKMKKGEPLLCNTALDIDLDAVHTLVLELTRTLASVAEEAGARTAEAARALLVAFEEQTVEFDTLLASAAVGKRDLLVSCAKQRGLDADLLHFVLRNALKPALRAWCRQLTPLVAGIPWTKGACFICGEAAALAELQGNNQTMHLRCSSCGSDWQFPRLRCVHCGNDDPDTQRFIDSGSRGRIMRTETCEKCKGYINVIAAFEPTPAEMLPIEELATLHLDFAAQTRGYSRQPIVKTQYSA